MMHYWIYRPVRYGINATVPLKRSKLQTQLMIPPPNKNADTTYNPTTITTHTHRWMSSALRWQSFYCRVLSDEFRWDRLSQFCRATTFENFEISGPTKNVAPVAATCRTCCATIVSVAPPAYNLRGIIVSVAPPSYSRRGTIGFWSSYCQTIDTVIIDKMCFTA